MERSLAKILPSLSRFRRDQDGSLTIMALFFFICMIMIGGLSVDIMVFENNRTRLQSLTDRAVLAAADMEQSGDPEGVVRSYFEKAGLADKLDAIQVQNGLLTRSVSVQTSNPMRTMFMNMTGVTQMTPRASATAAEGQGDLEIALVLDVSNSMNNPSSVPGIPTKLDDMKGAAKRFVDIVFAQSENDSITITLVPYNTQVNAGKSILTALNVPQVHDYSHCAEFSSGDYGTLSLSAGGQYDQAAHFDQWYSSEDPVVNVCRTGANQQIKLHQSNPDVIKTQLDALSAHGNTSSEIGLKWAAGFLDPASRPVTAALAAAGEVAPNMANRPLDYGTGNSQKVIVLLTDGINTDQKRIRPEYMSGESPVWRIFADQSLDFYAARIKEVGDQDGDGFQNEQFWIKGGTYMGVTWPDQFSSAPLPPFLASIFNTTLDPVRLSWSELWAEMNPRHYAYAYIADATENTADGDAFLNEIWANVSGPEKDDRLLQTCNGLRDAGVAVYTIGFEINDHAKDIMGRCASNANTFVNVVGDDLEDKFVSIATSITKLRLTQ
ncbi:hypothetical protein ILP92_03535 [Maribius pontilimi]|uniref:Putative Flp pilus-assembly TadG-like N-terminal domain-containing protein n=1 Tax=Palleronia pontilimi TaxID=1964209 RepID=A0A934MBS9_9RHOB|nr:pilus assembly protein TadG-related protein [Palleronia pontilimi]MBJ3761820.1 hypothetical protein [Palleronia pontilimi]